MAMRANLNDAERPQDDVQLCAEAGRAFDLNRMVFKNSFPIRLRKEPRAWAD